MGVLPSTRICGEHCDVWCSTYHLKVRYRRGAKRKTRRLEGCDVSFKSCAVGSTSFEAEDGGGWWCWRWWSFGCPNSMRRMVFFNPSGLFSHRTPLPPSHDSGVAMLSANRVDPISRCRPVKCLSEDTPSPQLPCNSLPPLSPSPIPRHRMCRVTVPAPETQG